MRSWFCYQQNISINSGLYFSEYNMIVRTGMWTIYDATYVWFDKFSIYGFCYYPMTMGSMIWNISSV